MSAASFQRGYIISPQSDFLWFFILPLIAVAAATLSHLTLPGVGLLIASVGVTVPHHFVTWMRVYGSPVEFSRWRTRLVLIPVVFIPAVFLMSKQIPLGLILLIYLWDNQHSIMQQYGFGRIYDFKAGTGGENTARFDYYLHWALFLNMLLVSPVFTNYWVQMLQSFNIDVTTALVSSVHTVSWAATGLYAGAYVLHLVGCRERGEAFNLAKYRFLFVSYAVWYGLAFATSSLLVWSIGHRIMHGGQYIVMVYFYNRNNVERSGGDSRFLRYLGQPGALHIAVFLAVCAGYTLFFWQLSLQRNFSQEFDLLAVSLMSSFGLIHYYFDSFIWKVRKIETQKNL
ncbi:MAG: hypothetical protein ACI8W3_002056 [Myxococcota bacterium]|jgi:hypothetical protein